jgi:hypothetical protein
MSSSSFVSLAVVSTLWLALVLGCAGSGSRQSSSPKQLTTEHRNAIKAALRSKSYPAPTSLEITDGDWLVATFELSGRVPGGSLQRFGEDAVVTIREAMLPFHLVEAYRVTLNGPSPGTGLIRRYGSARFIEGGQVEWETAR